VGGGRRRGHRGAKERQRDWGSPGDTLCPYVQGLGSPEKAGPCRSYVEVRKRHRQRNETGSCLVTQDWCNQKP